VIRAVLLDALGTLLALEDPGPRLVAELRARGAEVTLEQSHAAIVAEIAYYRAHHDEASDRERLADLRRRCADVLADALPAPARGLGAPALTEALLAALRFRPFPEVPAALAALRALPEAPRLVVLSNWDVSLHEQLDATGIAALVDGALSSAEIGTAKPAAAAFARALDLAGAAPGEALMVGDSVDADVEGALTAGLRAVLVDRHGAAGAQAPPGVPVVASLEALPGLVQSLA
jgi:putative hydrolase of the HAD superfamily